MPTTTGPIDVHCTNCGGSSTLTVVGILIGFLALGISLTTLAVLLRPYGWIARRLGARADFDLEIYIVSHELIDGVLETQANSIGIRIQAGMHNKGDKPATDLGINLLLPTYCNDLRWTAQDGRDLPDEPGLTRGPLSTAEELIANDGTRHASQYLSRTYQTQGLTNDRVAFARFMLELPDQLGTDVVVPVKLKVSSDDLPHGVQDRVEETEFRVRRVPR